jgi:hypothetical protein
MIGDGGGDVCRMVYIVEWFMDGSFYGEVVWCVMVAIFCVDKKEKKKGSGDCDEQVSEEVGYKIEKQGDE